MLASNSQNKLTVGGLLLGLLMAGIDNTIVATAMGTIVADLGGLDQFVWVTTSYMVSMMAATPIFGKLSDMYGRKRFYLLGLGLFLMGSMLCGTADSMTQLSLFRAIQGLGAGALFPISFTIMFDIFLPEQRGKMGGLFGAVFGLSSIVGPLLGAYITEYAGWRWDFYINVPIGVIAIALILIAYRESMEHRKQKIDWWGALTLVLAVGSLMFALELGGHKYAWSSPMILGLLAVFAVLALLSILLMSKERMPTRTNEPMQAPKAAQENAG